VGLFPHRTVAQNVATVPRLLGWPEARVRARVAEMLALVRLEGVEERLPAELSGGQAQRVGLARALAGDPGILLMDEPFGAVDPIVRRSLRAELLRIHRATGKTVMLVTHDPAEALELATRIVVLDRGRVAAAGAPRSLAEAGGEAVRDLFGGSLALARLRLTPVRAALEPAPPPPGAPRIGAEASLHDALVAMLEARARRVGVVEGAAEDALLLGSVSLDGLLEAGA
jgi:osmoprotectant transport system ATP-binding protein